MFSKQLLLNLRMTYIPFFKWLVLIFCQVHALCTYQYFSSFPHYVISFKKIKNIRSFSTGSETYWFVDFNLNRAQNRNQRLQVLVIEIKINILFQWKRTACLSLLRQLWFWFQKVTYVNPLWVQQLNYGSSDSKKF